MHDYEFFDTILLLDLSMVTLGYHRAELAKLGQIS